jgi:hypothetical protein
MFKKKLILIAVISFISCNNSKEKSVTKINYDTKKESLLTIDSTFVVGDSRRYGFVPNKAIGVHPKTQKNILEELLELANSGLNIKVSKGYYKTSFIIKNRKNLNFTFDNAEFAGTIQIIDSDSINLKGNITSYSSLVINNSSNITLDDISVTSNLDKNISKLASSGVQILNDSKQVAINKLNINGLGVGDAYKYAHAGLKIYGYKLVPKNIILNQVNIKNVSTNGALIIGDHITIKELKIDSFGTAKEYTLAKLSGVKQQYSNYAGLWIIKNTNSQFNTVNIISNKINNSLRLSPGDLANPTIIDELILTTSLTIENSIADDVKTNVIVKKVIKE